MSPPSCTTSPRGAASIIRSPAAEVARKLCPRFGLSAAETERVAWLVEQHLVMSNIAQGRDLSDPRTAETFGAVVQTMDRLRLLLALTVCDIRAVGPGVWNAWKGQLLRNLFWETEVVLGGGHSAIDRKSRVAAAREALRKALPNWSDPEFEAYAARHYPAYWLKVDLARQVEHAKLFYAMAAQVRSLTTEVSTDAKRGVTELTVIAPDHPRLLSVIAGACASAAANIVEAHIFTTTDGFALDSIFISREFRRGRRRTAARPAHRRHRGEGVARRSAAARHHPGPPQARRRARQDLRGRAGSGDRQHAVRASTRCCRFRRSTGWGCCTT